MAKKSKKIRVCIYLNKETFNKLETLEYPGKTRSYKINDLLNSAIEKSAENNDESIYNQFVKIIVASICKKLDENQSIISERIGQQINEMEFQANLLQALLKSIKQYSIANNRCSDISEATIRKQASDYVENNLKKDIDKIKKTK